MKNSMRSDTGSRHALCDIFFFSFSLGINLVRCIGIVGKYPVICVIVLPRRNVPVIKFIRRRGTTHVAVD